MKFFSLIELRRSASKILSPKLQTRRAFDFGFFKVFESASHVSHGSAHRAAFKRVVFPNLDLFTVKPNAIHAKAECFRSKSA